MQTLDTSSHRRHSEGLDLGSMPISSVAIKVREQQFPLFLIAVLLPLLALPFANLQGGPIEHFGLPLTLDLLIVQSIRSMPPWQGRGFGQSLTQLYRLAGLFGAIAVWVPFILQHNLSPSLRISMVLARTIFYVLTAMRIIDVLASSTRVNGHSLCLGAAGYIHYGLTCGQFATLMQLIDVDSFQLGAISSGEELLTRLSYFAFVTIGTLGFGDVVPGSPVGESFVVLVSISSTLYVSLLIGLLLSRYIAARAKAVIDDAEREGMR